MSKEPTKRIRVDVYHHNYDYEEVPRFRTRKEEEAEKAFGDKDSFDPPPRPRIVHEK